MTGAISEFRQKRHMTVSHIHVESDPDMEAYHWLERVQHGKNVYAEVFQMPPGV